MLNPDLLRVLLSSFGQAPIETRAEHCLNARHRAADCHLCVQACPAEAIALADGRPQLDADSCVNCGLCLHHCPTEVFDQRHAPERVLVETVTALEADRLALVCPVYPGAGSEAPVSTVVRHRRCLAALSPAWLLELAAGGQRKLWLDDSQCAECAIGRVQPAIRRAATTANELLAIYGRPAAILTSQDWPTATALAQRAAGQQPAPGVSGQPRQSGSPRASQPLPAGPRAKQQVVEVGQLALSRRGLFGSLGRRARQVAAEAMAEMLAAPEPTARPPEQRLPHRIPPSRGRLFSQLRRLGPPAQATVATSGIPFAQVEVGDTCSACGLCERFCPTGALRLEAQDDQFALHLTPAICIDCGLCALGCPEEAVSYGEQLPGQALTDTVPRVLVAGRLTPCTGCGTPVSTTAGAGSAGDGPRCFVCRSGRDPTRFYLDTADLPGASPS